MSEADGPRVDGGRGRHGDSKRLRELAAELGYPDDWMGHLVEAFTHKSYANEQRGDVKYNERLEFLGDAVLGMVVADALMRRHPDLPEGELSRLRASMVNARSLAQVADVLHLGAALSLGRGETRSGGRQKSSLLADAYEAMIGALYLDMGLSAARARILADFEVRLQQSVPRLDDRDFKTRVQEIVQRDRGETPTYEVVGATGPDHERTFEVELRVGEAVMGRGSGRSKKRAERAAAREAYLALTGSDRVQSTADGAVDPNAIEETAG